MNEQHFVHVGRQFWKIFGGVNRLKFFRHVVFGIQSFGNIVGGFRAVIKNAMLEIGQIFNPFDQFRSCQRHEFFFRQQIREWR